MEPKHPNEVEMNAYRDIFEYTLVFNNLFYLYPLETSALVGVDVLVMVFLTSLISGFASYSDIHNRKTLRVNNNSFNYGHSFEVVNFVLISAMYLVIAHHIPDLTKFIRDNDFLVTIFALINFGRFLDYVLHRHFDDFDLHLLSYNLFNPVFYIALGEIIKKVSLQ